VSIAQVDTDKYAPENYYVAIGAPQASTNGRGIVQVYKWGGDEAIWIQVGRDIEGDSELDQLGYDVSMAKNGTHLYLAIGIASHPDYENEVSDGGRVQVFKYNTDLDNTEWIHFGDEIEQYTDGDGTGQVVELSQNGMFLAIGAPNHKDGIGIVRIFKWNLDYGDYIRAGHYLEGKPDDSFGSCISISGNEVAIGAPYGGYVQVFTYDEPKKDGKTYDEPKKDGRVSNRLAIGLGSSAAAIVLLALCGVFYVKQREVQRKPADDEPSDEPRSVLPSNESSVLPSDEESSVLPSSDERSALPSDDPSVISSDEPNALSSDEESSVLSSDEPTTGGNSS
jgi:hypothetical protein